MNRCKQCGVDMDKWGRMHVCRPRPTAVSAEHLANSSDVANAASMANDGLANAPGRNRASSTYRYRNPDKRRTYQRDLMRKLRATGKAASPA
jgi:hypothetical protein